MNYFSDNGVDKLLIDELLPRFAITTGFACEVGANNGEQLSNTLALEDQGWTVLCIEPNPLLEAKGRAARKLWRQIAAGPEDREDAEFWALHPGNDYASNSALVVNGGVPYSSGPPADDMKFKVKVRTLDRLLEEAGFPRLDVLSIDVEGYEKEVLAGFSIERWNPAIIVVESVSYEMSPPEGYRTEKRLEFDNVFVRVEPEAAAE